MKFLLPLGIVILIVVGYTAIVKTPNIDDINFSSSISEIFRPSPSPTPKQTTLLLTGDIMLGRTVMTTSLDKSDPTYPFLKVADKLRAADITFGNLENPIISDCPRFDSGYTFCADPKMIEGLTFAGVDVVTLANNHTLNFGKKGLEETQDLLTQNNILITGIGKLTIKEVNGLKFGFLGFDKDQQSNPKLTPEEENLIKESDNKVDILVVGIHWGVEYQDHALPGVEKLAKQLVELGADVISGHHPHWVQNHEFINEVPVYYSLGNFVFDQMWSEETKKGLVVELTFEDKKIVKEELFNTYIRSRGQPEFINNEQVID